MAKTDLPTATAASSEVEINGESYELKPLHFRGWGRVLQKKRDQLIQAGREACADPALKERDKVLVLDRAYHAAAKVDLNYLDECLQDPEIMLYTVWLAVEGISFEAFDDAISMGDWQWLQETVQRIVNLSGLGESSAKGSSKKKRTTRRSTGAKSSAT